MKNKITLNHPLHFYVPFTRIDEEQRICEGYCYVNAKVASDKWNLKRSALESATAGYMEMPAVRAMHQPIAAGLGLGVVWDDKGALLRTKIVDDNEWNKVREKVYRGFSIGGRPLIVRGNDVEEFEWTETSLVDRPADPQAVFTMVRLEDENQPYEVEVEEVETTTTQEDNSNGNDNGQLQQQPDGTEQAIDAGNDDGQPDERAAELAGGPEPGLAAGDAGPAPGAPGRDERDVSAPAGSAGSDSGAVDAPVLGQSPDAADTGAEPGQSAAGEPGTSVEAERIDTGLPTNQPFKIRLNVGGNDVPLEQQSDGTLVAQRGETSADVPTRENLEGGDTRKPPVRRVHAYAHRMDGGDDCLHLNRADAIDHRDTVHSIGVDAKDVDRVAVIQGTAQVVGTFNDAIPVIEAQDDYDDINAILDTFKWVMFSTDDPEVRHQNVNELANYLDTWIDGEETEDADAMRADLLAIIARKGTTPSKKDSGHDSPPKGYPEDKSQYADPENYKYPIDTEAHAKAAWSYINKSENQSEYSASELASVKGKIKAACKKFGIDIAGDSGAERMERIESERDNLTAELATAREQLETARADLATAKGQVERAQKSRPQRFGTMERTFAANEQANSNEARRAELIAERTAISALDPRGLNTLQRQDNTRRLLMIEQELARL
jgi:hypothetical protein